LKPNDEKLDQVLRIAWWLLLAIAIGISVFIRIRLLQFPLERDEGEYAYSGQLMLQGIAPYKLAYSMKFPGTAATYALLMSIFGQTVAGIHLGLLLVNLATTALLFVLGRRIANSVTAGIVAAASYAVMSTSTSVLGWSAHATHLLMLPVMAGVLLLLRATDRQSDQPLYFSGLLFGLAMLMKQPAAVFILFGAAYLLFAGKQAGLSWKRIVTRELIFCASAVAPLLLTGLALWRAGVFEKFWFWTVTYAREYATLSSNTAAYLRLRISYQEVVGTRWILYVLAGVGLVVGFLKRNRARGVFLNTFFAFSVAALCVGLYFRPHYFFLILPALALLIGVAVATVPEFFRDRLTLARVTIFLVFGFALAWPMFRESKLLFALSPFGASRFIYGECPFPESVRIGEYLREHTAPEDTIAVLGSEPQIYFFAQRHSATGYLYTYELMEPQKYAHRMQLEMIQEIETARPKYLVYVVINDSWWPRPDSERLIFTWADKYCAENYSAVGLINIVAADQTDFYFGNVPGSLASLKDYILIYERK
jgi:4-amino-4-deoxy-L-arabinose transferase-like glycosyltransferase